MKRRTFLQAAALAGVTTMAWGDEPPVPIVDTHTHFFDPTRPQGVPWPGKDDKVLYRPVLPAEFKKLAAPLGVTGTVVVEASPWLEDNQWLLDRAGQDDFLVGIVGNLDPLAQEFPRNLARFAANRRWRGIRINHALVQKHLDERGLRAALGMLAERELTLDVNGGPDMPADVARLARQLPGLRVVINHAANVRIDGKAPPEAWRNGLRAAASAPNVFCKVSALVEGTGRRDRTAPRALDFYRPVLDVLWSTFGANRLIYGSNWPVCERAADYGTVLAIVRGFFNEKGRAALGKFCAGNAQAAYQLAARL